jgi:hypothetical protein
MRVQLWTRQNHARTIVNKANPCAIKVKAKQCAHNCEQGQTRPNQSRTMRNQGQTMRVQLWTRPNNARTIVNKANPCAIKVEQCAYNRDQGQTMRVQSWTMPCLFALPSTTHDGKAQLHSNNN